ncbi:MAG: amidohydrolase [Bradymonadaceae bacterium]|nr:amidohydrolase [Lujinxingiaceae bacterium]
MTAPPENLFERVEKRILAQNHDLIDFRRYLHAHPELSQREFQTTQTIRERLEGLGLSVHARAEGTGLYADLVPPDFDPELHPTIAIRSDIDALPILELNEVPYASRHKGVMHACGHDVHMATVFGTGMGLAAVRESLPGRIRLIYQHAEESIPGGAMDMVAFGAVDGADAVLALHCDPELPVGQIGVKPGAFTAAFDLFEFKIIGKGGHGARPHQCIDPIFVATQLATALYQAFGRNFDSRIPMVLTIGTIQGGTVSNVIPEEVHMSGSIRTISAEGRDGVEPLLRRIAGGVCMTHGASYELRLERGAPGIVNDPAITTIYAEVGAAMLGDENVFRIPLPSMGGEDFSYYLERTPGAMFRLGTADGGPRHPLHSPHFDIDERAITIGARILARSAIRLLFEHAIRMKTDRLVETV